MLAISTVRKAKSLVLAAALSLSPLSPLHESPKLAQAASPHSKLAAVYAIRFAGIRLGKFEVWSNMNAESYSMRGKGQLKFITGLLFEITGDTTSTGAVTKSGPRPTTFAFDFKTKQHGGQLAMMFDGNSVSHVMAKPPFVESPNDIPVTAEHVKGVLDPMSAIFFTASQGKRNKDGSICPDRIPVFDGKQRFDLQLSYKKTVNVDPRGKGGYHGPATVCKIKYVPIAGYKPDNTGIKYMADNEDIEVWLIKVPQKNMFVPYYVNVPTPFGKASATSTGLHIEIPGQEKISVIR